MANEENCRVYSVFRPKSGIPLDYYVAKFDANSSVDFKTCPFKIERENNFKEFKSIYGTDTDMPTSGAGSEYGREKREESKRKKFGFKTRQYDPKSQPFILKMGAGKAAKKMKGTKNGGVAKNTGYVAFIMTPQKHFISLPISDWYNFAPVSKRVTLSIEEAEEHFSKRDKIYNHFAIMTDKKKDKKEDDDDDFEGKPAKPQKRNRSENEIGTLSDSDEERNSDDDRKNKKRKRNEKSDDDETVEVGDEDEGVDEGKELDYLSDDSDDEEPLDEDVDEFNDFGQDDDEEQLADDKSDDDDEEDSDIDGEKKDDSDSDSDEDIGGLFGGPSGTKESVVKDSISADGKRKSDDPESNLKKPKLEANPVSNGKESLEDFVRDCLRKKPISTSDLLRKVAPQFSKHFSMKELQQKLVTIIKKLSPQSRNIEGTMHLYL